LEEIAMSYPANYRYTREHEWIELTGNIGAIGITDYAQNSLGDIVYVDMPKVGDTVTANATFGSVESVKAVSDLFAPVTGTVTAINEELTSAPDKINEAPHETWIIKVELADPTQVNALLDAAEQSVRQSFEPPDIVEADRHVAAVANIIGNWSINAAREVAWDTAVALWQVRDHPTATRLLTGGLARTVAMASRGLLVAV